MTLKRILLSIISISLVVSGLTASPIQKELNYGWEFKQARLNNWYPATVPGVVHTDLINNGIIEDPFFRLNERGVQWIDKEDWIYQTRFNIDDDAFSKSNILLHFKGLDTYADVYLNEVKILSANNMFREWHVDIKQIAKQKDNLIKIYFRSPIKEDLPKWEALPFQYQAINDQSENGGLFDRKLSVFTRKAGYHYGWDWGPRLVTSGIWRPILLEAWNDLRIEDVFVKQRDVSAKSATISVNTQVVADKDMAGVKTIVKDNKTGVVLGTMKSDLKKGKNVIALEFNIKNPKLWWSNGLGDPNMYELATEISTESGMLDSDVKEIGIRSLKIIHKPDKDGTSFYFELNGIPVFAKGANYIPSDNFLPRVTKEKYEKTILDAVNANMNTLRVWGGGIYEDDYFYKLCDRYGIMVWQDFMFACSLYPAEGELMENIKQEAIDNIKRLRNHPSIALWCGNNECLEAWFGWGWNKQYREQNPDFEKKIWSEYENLYHKLLPELVNEYDPESFYWPSSPFARKDGVSDDKNGDRHYWDVWHSRKPISEYNVQRSRFFSEYGFQSFPEFESIKIYAPNKEDWSITSEVMMDHQRGGTHANSLIEDYLLKEYRKPKNFESFLYMNLVLQGDAIKTAIEAHRRDKPYCMGTLFWQHNDCWPVASWSSRDYYGRWKAQHYFAREAYKDLLVSPIIKDEKLDIYIVSDRLKNSTGKLGIVAMNLDGTSIYKKELAVNIPENTSKVVYSEWIKNITKNVSKEDIVIHITFKDENGKEYSNSCFLVQQKDINFPVVDITSDIKPTNNGFEVTLNSNKFARAVFLSIEGIDNFFEDNYFDLLPNIKKTIKVQSKLSLSDFKKQLKVVSLVDGY